MRTSINGVDAEWTPAILAAWKSVGAPDARRANWYTARPYVDTYNRGSEREGFLYTDRQFRVLFVERIVSKPSAPYTEPRGDWTPMPPSVGLDSSREITP